MTRKKENRETVSTVDVLYGRFAIELPPAGIEDAIRNWIPKVYKAPYKTKGDPPKESVIAVRAHIQGVDWGIPTVIRVVLEKANMGDEPIYSIPPDRWHICDARGKRAAPNTSETRPVLINPECIDKSVITYRISPLYFDNLPLRMRVADIKNSKYMVLLDKKQDWLITKHAI